MDAIIIIVDQFTKMIQLKATIMNISSEGIVKIYRDNIWKLYGIPKKILSDREPQFALNFIEELINQEIETFLQHYVNYQQDNWMNWLAAVEFQYNDKKHVVTRRILFELNFRKHPWKGNLVVQTEIP